MSGADRIKLIDEVAVTMQAAGYRVTRFWPGTTVLPLAIEWTNPGCFRAWVFVKPDGEEWTSFELEFFEKAPGARVVVHAPETCIEALTLARAVAR